ncbi:MAG: zinc ribbon domain-containing protein [Anaerolineae bacterium]
MPTYLFLCRDCGQSFDRRLRMSQSSETQACPSCGSKNTRKRIGAVAVNGPARVSGRAATPPPGSPFS